MSLRLERRTLIMGGGSTLITSVAMAGRAEATAVRVSGRADPNDGIHVFTKQRRNLHRRNHVWFEDFRGPGGGGSVYFHLISVRTGKRIGSTSGRVWDGRRHHVFTPGGSRSIPYGAFVLNLEYRHAQCGISCPPGNFSAILHYNIAA